VLKIKNRLLPRKVVYVFLLAWCVLFAWGLAIFPGGALYYSGFSFVFLLLLCSGLDGRAGYGYLFATVMLWSGFWLKLVVHLGLNYDFIEPTGRFTGTPTQWNGVLEVASVGAAGILAGRALYSICMNAWLSRDIVHRTMVPGWFISKRKTIWIISLLSSAFFAILNAKLGIQQNGLVPQTILIWPLNAVIAWVLSSGLSIIMITLLWWDVTLGSRLFGPLCIIVFEAFFSTISLLSRGVYVFHTIFVFIALCTVGAVKNLLSKKAIAILSLLFVTCFVGSIVVTNIARGKYYSDLDLIGRSSNYKLFLSNSQLAKLPSFVIDRWIGIEGLMATYTYPGKGERLLKAGLVERRQIGKETLYQEICLSIYRFSDVKKFQFASIPGPIAFFYYSGSLIVVFFGMLLMALVLLGSETLVASVIGNPLLCAWVGAFMANWMCQFGLAPISVVPYMMEMAMGIAMVRFLEKTIQDVPPKTASD
jgi:hypothetical protein